MDITHETLKATAAHAERMAAIWEGHAVALRGVRGGVSAQRNAAKYRRTATAAKKALWSYEAECYGDKSAQAGLDAFTAAEIDTVRCRARAVRS